MTMKLMVGILFFSLLLLTNFALAAERSSSGPAVAKLGAVPSDCDCLKKDKAPTSPGLKADAFNGGPLQTVKQMPCLEWRCRWVWDQYYHRWVYRCWCVLYMPH